MRENRRTFCTVWPWKTRMDSGLRAAKTRQSGDRDVCHRSAACLCGDAGRAAAARASREFIGITHIAVRQWD